MKPMREPDRRSHWVSGNDFAKVEITYERDGAPVTIDCAKHPYYHQNLRVLFFALEALRMNEVRGVTDVVDRRTACWRLRRGSGTPGKYWGCVRTPMRTSSMRRTRRRRSGCTRTQVERGGVPGTAERRTRR